MPSTHRAGRRRGTAFRDKRAVTPGYALWNLQELAAEIREMADLRSTLPEGDPRGTCETRELSPLHGGGSLPCPEAGVACHSGAVVAADAVLDAGRKGAQLRTGQLLQRHLPPPDMLLRGCCRAAEFSDVRAKRRQVMEGWRVPQAFCRLAACRAPAASTPSAPTSPPAPGAAPAPDARAPGGDAVRDPPRDPPDPLAGGSTTPPPLPPPPYTAVTPLPGDSGCVSSAGGPRPPPPRAPGEGSPSPEDLW
ncbi:hypothetical protein TSOC_009122 [Tetrabaena socialis]|uniref:Uncharacterized protein n=1 Tax=Tetrabaena socialis TaxID=47790 RepID=A0A2J7ZWK5_9CHLO|nr:hypothetical protein TSOC_009122 [Tetrabaena socialis]|eukprot:PNH04671.1 hypothetical protein TSOC_009122 [Tetrabaena socialis]